MTQLQNLDKKEQLISLIKSSNEILKDCLTFPWLRINEGEIEEFKERPGGGNYLIALGAFSALNLYSTIYYLLKINQKLLDSKTNRNIEIIHELLKVLEIKKYFRYKELDEVNYQDAFCVYIQDLKKYFKLDLNLNSNDEAILAWRLLRNTLTHISTPLGNVSIGTLLVQYSYEAKVDLSLPINDPEKIKLIIQKARRPKETFKVELLKKKVQVNSDLLLVYTIRSQEFLINYINNSNNDSISTAYDRIEKIINKQYGIKNHEIINK